LDAALVRRWGRALPDDGEFGLLARFLSCTALLDSGDERFLVRFRDGVVTDVAVDPDATEPWTFALRARPEAWERFLRDPPPPGFHDVWALVSRGEMVVEGDTLVFMQNHYALWRALTVLRSEAQAV